MKQRIYNVIFSIILIFSFSNCNKLQSNDPHEKVFVPDSAVFSKESPVPRIVRGFDMPEGFKQVDCNDAKRWGANVIRIQIFPARYATKWNQNFWDAWPSYLDYLVQKVEYVKNAGLKVVIDLQEPPFQQVNNFDQAEFWNRKDLEERFCKVWSGIAERLLPYKETIWGYDILNEPLDRSQLPSVARQWKPLAIKIVEAIRKVDPNAWIIFEPGPGSLCSGFKGLSPLPDLHIIYSGHFYYPQDFTHQGVFNIEGTDLAEIKDKINIPYPSVINGEEWDKQHLELMIKDVDAFQKRWKVPVYIGEFSVIRWAPKESAIAWLQDVVDLFESRNWSWTYHSFREWNGWSLEYDEQFWREGMTNPTVVPYDTERAKIIKNAFLKN